MATNLLKGFSKLNRKDKIQVLQQQFSHIDNLEDQLNSFLHPDSTLQQLFDDFSENTLTNYYLPYGIAPNFLIDGNIYHVPMVIEESSVVAAASYAAKFWSTQEGFATEVIDTLKPGHVHLHWAGNFNELSAWFDTKKADLLQFLKPLTTSMETRGGGIRELRLQDFSTQLPAYRQLVFLFDTADAMGANFINSCLEEAARILVELATGDDALGKDNQPVVIMSILSNYTPQCVVKCQVRCPVSALKPMAGTLDSDTFAWKFQQAVEISRIDPYRAATHNKGVFNGVDAVVLATGNDFRAIEAGGHTYAAKSGSYRGLTSVNLDDNVFTYTLALPLSLGTVGGLTALHPMAALAMKILGNPGAKQLMRIIAAAGMANNFSAVRSLVTQGIQKGHMKMHLNNILNQLQATENEKKSALKEFESKTVSFQEVRLFLESIRYE